MLKTVEITAVTIQQIGFRFNAHKRKRINFNKKFTVFANEKGVVLSSSHMGQHSQNIQCHCEPVTDVTGVAIPRIDVKSKIS